MNFTQDEARKALDIGRSYYSQIESGKRRASNFLMQKFELIENAPASLIADVLDDQSARTMEHAQASGYVTSRPKLSEGRVLKVRRLPLIGWAQAGQAVDFEDIVDWDESVTVEINDPRAIAVRVRGDSMAPDIMEGDIVVASTSDKAEDEQIVIARLRDEGVVLKKLKIVDAAARLFRLVSLNPKYPPIDRTEDQFFWIYPVDQLIKRMRNYKYYI